MRRPLDDIIKHTSEDTPEYEMQDVPSYRLYSAHDTNVANFLRLFNPSLNFTVVPYASNIYFEVYRTMDIPYHKSNFFTWERFTVDKKYMGFQVRMVFNGTPLILEGCNGQEYCSIEDFKKYMTKILYQGDLKEACFQPVPNMENDHQNKSKWKQMVLSEDFMDNIDLFHDLFL